MTCPTCHDPIPEAALYCPTCLEHKSRKAVLEHQKQFLPGILTGVYALTLTKSAEQPAWHMRLIFDTGHAWCGETISPKWKRKRYIRLTEEPGNLCPRCLDVFEQMAKEVASWGNHLSGNP